MTELTPRLAHNRYLGLGDNSEPLGEEQRRSGKSHPGGKGFRELFPRAYHSRKVLGLGLPGQGWCRREHSGGTGVDRQEC
jgi:hypothetical protein